MPRLSKTEWIAFVAATVAGACLHFLYTLLPCPATALVAPVRESLWEHVKLLYWPCLIAGLVLRRRQPELLGQRAFALLAATALVSIALFSMIFYHWCLHAKQTEALTQGDGPLWAFEQGELEVVEEDPDGATVYGGAGYQVQVRDGFVTSVRDDNKGFTKLYEQGVLTSITFDNPLGEAVTLCTPFQVDSYVEYPVRTSEEARAIREDIDAEGAASLRDQGLRCWELDNGYLVVEA